MAGMFPESGKNVYLPDTSYGYTVSNSLFIYHLIIELEIRYGLIYFFLDRVQARSLYILDSNGYISCVSFRIFCYLSLKLMSVKDWRSTISNLYVQSFFLQNWAFVFWALFPIVHFQVNYYFLWQLCHFVLSLPKSMPKFIRFGCKIWHLKNC